MFQCDFIHDVSSNDHQTTRGSPKKLPHPTLSWSMRRAQPLPKKTNVQSMSA